MDLIRSIHPGTRLENEICSNPALSRSLSLTVLYTYANCTDEIHIISSDYIYLYILASHANNTTNNVSTTPCFSPWLRVQSRGGSFACMCVLCVLSVRVCMYAMNMKMWIARLISRTNEVVVEKQMKTIDRGRQPPKTPIRHPSVMPYVTWPRSLKKERWLLVDIISLCKVKPSS